MEKVRKLRSARGIRTLALVFVCFYGIGCGSVGQNSSVKLGVPYRSQAPNSLDCGPASILMWRLYDGLPEISQSTIGSWMGGTSCGSTEQNIANAVNHFTGTHDAYVDNDGNFYPYRENFFSRQITSIDNAVPVIANIGGFHVGVLNGGKWRSLSGGRYEWIYVYVHDPQTVANDYYESSIWTAVNCPSGSDTCAQIVSSSAIAGWQTNQSTFGNYVIVRGYYCPFRENDRSPGC